MGMDLARQKNTARAFHAQQALEVAKDFDSDPNVGLSQDEAAGRLVKYGQNELTLRRRQSRFRSIIAPVSSAAHLHLVIVRRRDVLHERHRGCVRDFGRGAPQCRRGLRAGKQSCHGD
jgi:hypothetical protein